jgi:uncharacterized protein YecT (DUF1311 family)
MAPNAVASLRLMKMLILGAACLLAATGTAHATDCQRASTQAELNVCAHEDFLAAQAEMAAQLQALQSGYSTEQRQRFRRVQRAWLNFRTESCAFESRQGGASSSQPMRQSLCAARLTRERAGALARMAQCPEGDVTCVRPAARIPAR